MAIESTAPRSAPVSGFGRVFGQSAQTAAPAAPQDRPKAQWWLNLGYKVNYPVEGGGTEERLVSLPVGTPLDTQEPIRNNSKNPVYAEFVGARNHLLEQLMERAKQMKPGEVIDLDLVVQLRCVDDSENTVVPQTNGFIKNLFG
jgi:hypothetical protein